ncbi:DNA-binding protein [Virgibacillus sp. SK37]|nr:DNA-binding protein [Virgibacillus sp. SK37]
MLYHLLINLLSTMRTNVVQAQVDLYHLEEGNLPLSLDSLIQKKYIKASQTECPSKEKLKYQDGIVSAPPTNG